MPVFLYPGKMVTLIVQTIVELKNSTALSAEFVAGNCRSYWQHLSDASIRQHMREIVGRVSEYADKT